MLKDRPLNPAAITKETKDHRSTVSRTFKELASRDYIKCLNPDERNFRLYRITKKGLAILKKVKRIA
jgi:DNA-binding MarR family transcriptional regulator